MEAVRYIEEVDSNTITLKNLDQFKGQKVEIIIMPYETEPQFIGNLVFTY